MAGFPTQSAIVSNDEGQRIYKKDGMPKRSPQEQRLLEKVLGHRVQDDSSTKTELPPDVLIEINKIVTKNRELTAQIPTILENQAKMDAKFNATLAQLTDVLKLLTPLSTSVKASDKINPAVDAPNSAGTLSIPNFKKDKKKHSQGQDPSDSHGDLPPSEV